MMPIVQLPVRSTGSYYSALYNCRACMTCSFPHMILDHDVSSILLKLILGKLSDPTD